MKKVFFLMAFLCFSQFSISQAFPDKGGSVYSLTTGFSRYRKFQHFTRLDGGVLDITGKGEYTVHKYLGVGWTLSAGYGVSQYGFNNIGYSINLTNAGYNSRLLYLSGGVDFNFHFYKLIDDKTKKFLHSDELDIYVGLNVSAGAKFRFANSPEKGSFHNYQGIINGGIHLGVRWFPKGKNIGLMGEFGYGTRIASLGVVFKFNKK